MEYINRRNMFHKEKKFILNDAHFSIEGADGNVTVPYGEVRTVRLKYMPNRYDANIYRCTLETSRGEFVLVNKYVAGFLDFRDQSPAYREFIFEMHRRLAQQNPRVHFIGGTGAFAYWAMLLFDIAMIVFVALTMIFIPFDFSVSIIIRLLLIAYLAFATVQYFKNNRPVVYRPDGIPERLMPELKPPSGAGTKTEQGGDTN
jgi:hypothetical protein